MLRYISAPVGRYGTTIDSQVHHHGCRSIRSQHRQAWRMVVPMIRQVNPARNKQRYQKASAEKVHEDVVRPGFCLAGEMNDAIAGREGHWDNAQSWAYFIAFYTVWEKERESRDPTQDSNEAEGAVPTIVLLRHDDLVRRGSIERAQSFA